MKKSESGIDREKSTARTEARASNLLVAYTDADILRAYDNGLADFHLAQRYQHNAHLRNPIQHWLDQLGAELKRRGIEYSHARARAAK